MFVLLNGKLYLVDAASFQEMWKDVPSTPCKRRDEAVFNITEWVKLFQVIPMPVFDLDDRI